MADVLTKSQRSYCMSRVKSSRTEPELKIRGMLKKRDYSYQPKMPFSPDFACVRKKTIIFVDGCFWHACSKHKQIPKANRRYWSSKIRRNIVRASEANTAYRISGWRVIRLWEHDLQNISLNKIKSLITHRCKLSYG